MPVAMLEMPFGHTVVRRIAPNMGPEAYKTYGMSMPLSSHWRAATCEEVSCDAWIHGWVSTFDLSTDLGQRQFEFCKNDRERGFSMQRPGLSLVKFVYPPGNRCFRSSEHRLPLDRPARLYVAEGDFRGNPRRIPARVHTRAEHWVEDFSEHQDRLATAIQRG